MVQLPGVFLAKKKDGSIYYRASITYQNKHISLGSFSDSQKAHLAYLEAQSILTNNLITIHNSDSQKYLSYEKFIILLNFRDNKLYFKTPIYLYNSYFIYYFSESILFKFDKEDLFFYSTHKIMKKDGYYFISDYGMQINILTRYGIRNYAIVEKDYRFINGDPFDFRYENIQILQQYYGVEKVIFRGTERYLAKIHVNGYYQIGRYQTPLDAAIAYNKAIDILHKKGYQKNYSINYISTLSNAEYANRYYELPISKKILCLPNKK